jgi:hypothetical protein
MTNFNALEMAKRNWPHCTISGSGSIAVILGCCYKVQLCQIPIEAQAIASAKCGPHCSHTLAPHGGWHEVIVLQPPATSRPALRNNFRAFMDAD